MCQNEDKNEDENQRLVRTGNNALQTKQAFNAV